MNSRNFRRAEREYLSPPDDDDDFEECETCEGSGEIITHDPPEGDIEKESCDDCEGSGQISKRARRKAHLDDRADQAYQEYKDRKAEKLYDK